MQILLFRLQIRAGSIDLDRVTPAAWSLLLRVTTIVKKSAATAADSHFGSPTCHSHSKGETSKFRTRYDASHKILADPHGTQRSRTRLKTRQA